VRSLSNDADTRPWTPVMGIELKGSYKGKGRPARRGSAERAKKSFDRQKPVTTATRTDRGEPGVILLLLWAVAKYSRSNTFSTLT
jgi:hypothetical protein